MAQSPKHLYRFLLENKQLLANVKYYQQQKIKISTNHGVLNPQNIATQVREDNDSYATQLAPQVTHDSDIGTLFKASDLNIRLAAPTQLQPKPEINELGFGKHFTDHMMKIYYHKNLGGWQSPEITPFEHLVLHPATKVLHYAVTLFEGLKAYRGDDGRIRIFRPDMNMHRMNITARRCGLPTFEGKEYIKCLAKLLTIEQEWVPFSKTASLYIRPTIIGIDSTLGISSSDSALLSTILSPVGSEYFNTPGAISLLADPTFIRAWPGGCGDRKMGSNYAPTVHVQKIAASRGLQQVLWLYGDDHQLTEVGTMNIFVLYVNEKGEKELITPALDGLTLPGITRDSVLKLTRYWNKFNVREGKITMPTICDLLSKNRLLEMFGTGTACIVSPINRINYLGQDLLIPTMEQEKPLYNHLRTSLTDIQYGKVDHPWAVTIC